jgi:D-alanine--poly(phosphoribitol) ligase subunit 2
MTADIAHLRNRLLTMFRNTLYVSVPSVDLDLFDAGILDSAGFVELLLQLEREFGVKAEIDDLEVDNFRSISCIAEYVMARGDLLDLEDSTEPVSTTKFR